MVTTTRSRFWGPLFPDVWDAGVSFWGPLFPDPGPALDEVTPTSPAGVATFVLDLDATLTMTLEWQTDVFKADDGKETRAAVLDFPRRRFKGSALLIGGSSVRNTRTKLQRWAAQGATFELGLPFEGLRLASDAADETLTVNVGALANCDWANPGQRCVVVGKNRTAVNAVIQSASGTSIVLDIAPGAIGDEGGSVMPTVPIFLAPQQGFSRYVPADGFERWQIDASVASFGWRKAAVAAILDLEAAGAVNCTGLFVQARTPGVAGNSIRVAMIADLDPLSSDDVSIDEVGNDITIHFIPDSATVQELADAINLHSTLVRAIGSWNGPFELQETSDEFVLTSLSGGSDGDYADDGTGATVATHAGIPVFDRGLVNDSTIDDSLQAMNEIVSHGGISENTAHATASDWGRAVALEDKLGPEFQWLKRFLSTVRGRQLAFWLPTWRNDLVATETGTGTLTIANTTDEDFFVWYATRQNIQIRQVDGTITRCTITAAVDNGDGTITLTTGVTLNGSAVELVSWLELCHFEDDAIDIAFVNHLFATQTTARAVQQ